MGNKNNIIEVNAIDKEVTIGIFSPSEPVINKRIEKFNAGINLLHENGFKTKLSKNVFAHTNYTAGDVKTRINDIHDLLDDDNVDILLSSWGGKGCSQLLKYLDYEKIKIAKKPILGFSDPCVLTNYISATTGLVTFYGPNVVGKLDQTSHLDFTILKPNLPKDYNILGNIDCVNSKIIFGGKATGKLFGGNLSTFVLGAVSSDIPRSFFDDGIFFWEELNMPIQIIDQYMTALKNMGIIDNLKGMVIGHFLCEEEKEWKKTEPFEAINNMFKKYNFPIIYSPTFGHIKLENPIFPIGALCTLDTSKKSLTLESKITRIQNG